MGEGRGSRMELLPALCVVWQLPKREAGNLRSGKPSPNLHLRGSVTRKGANRTREG